MVSASLFFFFVMAEPNRNLYLWVASNLENRLRGLGANKFGNPWF
jgi:hypothetical protein